MEEEDAIIEENDLLTRRIDFKVKIESAKLPDNFCRDTYVEYSVLGGNGANSIYKTNIVNTFLNI